MKFFEVFFVLFKTCDSEVMFIIASGFIGGNDFNGSFVVLFRAVLLFYLVF